MIELIARRSNYTSERGGRYKEFHVKLGIEARNLNELFVHLDKYLALIDKDERWNVFFTQSEDFSALDIDYVSDQSACIKAVEGIVTPKAITSTGNGLNFFFPMETLNEETLLKIKGTKLHGFYDPIFENRKYFVRMPGTENRKRRPGERLPILNHRTQCILLEI